MTNILTCKNEQRRHRVRKHQNLNGLDYLEVSDDQRTLTVYFLGKAPQVIFKENVSITGGRRIRDLRVIAVEIQRQEEQDLDDYLEVVIDRPGDFSTYTLSLVQLDENGKPTNQPLQGFDPRYSQLNFSFKINCSSDLDCKSPEVICPPKEQTEPEINYLAKDYASFRQLILDRLSLILPDWQERHVPDLGITLVEILAYVGDRLSYYQDAVATEAYLDTARQRISVRRHTRLIDYYMHEGCNARALVCVKTDMNLSLKPEDFYFITAFDNPPNSSKILTLTSPNPPRSPHPSRSPVNKRLRPYTSPLVRGKEGGGERTEDEAFYQGGRTEKEEITNRTLASDDLRNVLFSQYEVFEPITTKSEISLYQAQNKIIFYTWGDRECCLARGATTATLKVELNELNNSPEELNLEVGDILIFEEVKGTKTGNPADADLNHRHGVRLTKVTAGVDELYNQPIVEIEWAQADALPFPLCLSAIGPAPECALLEDISIARGNVILVDHGRTIKKPEFLGCVKVKETQARCEAEGRLANTILIPSLFRPRLQENPLTFSQPLNANTPINSLFNQDPRQALPQVQKMIGKRFVFDSYVEEIETEWTSKYDLLSSKSDDQDFVVEIDNDGRAHLRFGNGELRKLPETEMCFEATYRVGNGLQGNVGAEAISFLVFHRNAPNGVNLQARNPLAAQGGISSELLDEVKLYAPHAFRKQLERAITAEDYVRLAQQHSKVQSAAATLRWMGSWYEVLVAIDPLSQETTDESLLQEIAGFLYPYRRVGHDLVVVAAQYVPLDIELNICVLPNYLRAHVKTALMQVFSNRNLADGKRGFFHPDNLIFGQGIALSKLVAIAQQVPGVESVTFKKLERLYEGPNKEIENGFLPISPLEIARVDNDPNFPENGQFRLILRGGR
ncbi:MAG: hypothetical protein U7123_13465 [Potamolinea sp.]